MCMEGSLGLYAFRSEAAYPDVVYKYRNQIAAYEKYIFLHAISNTSELYM